LQGVWSIVIDGRRTNRVTVTHTGLRTKTRKTTKAHEHHEITTPDFN
jgi:hypothetical protein